MKETTRDFALAATKVASGICASFVVNRVIGVFGVTSKNPIEKAMFAIGGYAIGLAVNNAAGNAVAHELDTLIESVESLAESYTQYKQEDTDGAA